MKTPHQDQEPDEITTAYIIGLFGYVFTTIPGIILFVNLLQEFSLLKLGILLILWSLAYLCLKYGK